MYTNFLLHPWQHNLRNGVVLHRKLALLSSLRMYYLSYLSICSFLRVLGHLGLSKWICRNDETRLVQVLPQRVHKSDVINSKSDHGQIKGPCATSLLCDRKICLVSLWSIISDNQKLRWLPWGRNSSWDKQMIFQISLNWGSIVIGFHRFPNDLVLLAVHAWFVCMFTKYSTPAKH